MALGPVLGRADEHLDHVVVQTVVELALEFPLELRMIEVPGMKLEVIGVHWDRRIPEVDDDFYGFALGAGGKMEQWVLVQFQLRQNALKPRVCRIAHNLILSGVVVRVGRAPSPAGLGDDFGFRLVGSDV